ncbi:MAG: DUF2007 domain-containing protein [Myxococcales bacterium]|nr:DUF2007 domain-containing protein [Myxococcales bacterium]
MTTQSQGHVVVFRAVDPHLLDLVQGMLDSEGMQPRRLGGTNAALMGGGTSAFEQLIEVPARHAEAARTLIEASQTPSDAEELTRQALAGDDGGDMATGARDDAGSESGLHARPTGSSAGWMAAAVIAGVVALLWILRLL